VPTVFDKLSAVSTVALKGTLDRLEGDGQRFLQRARVREELRKSAGVALFVLPALPLLLLAMVLVRRVAGAVPALWGWINAGTFVALAVCGSVLYVFARVAMVHWRYSPHRRGGLALYDAELKTHDRLVTADEFLDHGVAGNDRDHSFRQAAVDDAGSYARSALAAVLSPLSLPQWRVQPLSLLGIPAALLLAVLMLSVGSRESRQIQADAVMRQAAMPHTDLLTGPEAENPQAPARRRREAQEAPRQPEVPEQQTQPSPQRPSQNAKAAEGQADAGASAQAQSASSSSTTAGDPSGQKNASRPRAPGEEPPPEDPDDNKEAKSRRNTPQQKSTSLAMDAASGQGRTAVSRSSPSEFNLPEEDDKAGVGSRQDARDEDAEDEDEQEKSNGANKPSLRDNKSPTDRTLNQAFTRSDKPDKRSNGRSGPTGRKKTRGVPSMILGLPVQDRIQGMLNPGRSKVTQEQARPKEETHPSLDAQIRLARHAEIGALEHPGLQPWMRSLVTDYFLQLRENR
jgi:hypothetical protein